MNHKEEGPLVAGNRQEIVNFTKKSSPVISHSSSPSEFSFFQSVPFNKFREVGRRADDTRALCRNIGSRPPPFFENLLANSYIRNTTLTIDDS